MLSITVELPALTWAAWMGCVSDRRICRHSGDVIEFLGIGE